MTFQAGDGVTMNAYATAAPVAYVKYGEAGLYTDITYETEFTIPTVTANNGYELPEAYWSDGENSYTDAQVKRTAFTDSVTLTAIATSSHDFNVPDGVTVVSGVQEGKASFGTDVELTVDEEAAEGYDVVLTYQVGDGDPVTVTPDDNGTYTIPGSAITGPVTVTLTKTVAGDLIYITYDEYKGAPSHHKVAVLVLDGDQPSDKEYRYDGKAMFWAQPEDTTAPYGTGAYVFFVDSDEEEEETLAKITIVSGENEDVDYDGDVNLSGRVEINDAQLVYDLYNNNRSYSENFDLATMLMRFKADVNGDGTVGVDDVRMIYSIIMGL